MFIQKDLIGHIKAEKEKAKSKKQKQTNKRNLNKPRTPESYIDVYLPTCIFGVI